VRALRLRSLLFRGARGAEYAEAARWLGSAQVDRFLQSDG
jgi:hypothetical protein